VSRPRLDGTRFALAGPGRVGASLARWLAAHGAQPVAFAGRPGSQAAARLALELGGRAVTTGELTSADADLLLLALPDGVLGAAAADLACRAQAAVALHTAGALSFEILAPLAAAGVATGGWHPLRAFPEASRDPADARGVFFALDGAPPALAAGRRLAEALGGESAPVPASARPLYHFAATLAAGGVTTLLACAADLASRLGLPDAVRAGYAELARGALAAAAAAADPADAITGPAARGDAATIERHLEALERAAPDLLPLALEVARATLAQRARREPPDAERRALSAGLERAELLDRPKVRVLTSLRKP